MKPAYDLLLWDLDGTLTDPQEGITRCVQYALGKMGIEVTDRNALNCFIGPPLIHSFAQHFGMNRAQADQAVVHYRERFAAGGLFENRVYPGVPGLLTRLRSAGARHVLASCKPDVYCQRILDHFGLLGHFEFVAGAALDGSRLEKNQVVAHALERCAPKEGQRVIMIGDSDVDVEGARACGVQTIAVTWGYGDPVRLEAARPAAVAGSIEELEVLLLG